MNMLAALLDSLARHFGWWARALVDWRDPRAPMRPRRAAILLLAAPLFLCVQTVHAVGLLLDEVFFPRYRRVRIGRALFITGIPRSGTSFLHRTLAVDADRFTTLTTWEALFAPSITQRRIVRGAAAVDRRLGGHATRAIEALTRRLTGGLDDIHAVGLRAAEEDYLVLLPAGGCFIMLLAFPGAPGLQALGQFDRRMPNGRRRRLLRFYRRCLQRHLYADGGERTLLSKNAAFGSWIVSLHETFPQARFLICIRRPAEALSSQISAVASAERLFGARVGTEAFQRGFLEVFGATLDHLADTLAAWPPGRGAVIDMEDLRTRPQATVQSALARIGMPAGPSLSTHLAALPGRHRSDHTHRIDALALERERLDARMEPPYRRLLASPHRVGAVS